MLLVVVVVVAASSCVAATTTAATTAAAIATVAAAILGHNFKSSLWYQESYNLLGNLETNTSLNGFRGWLGDVYRQVIRGEWI